MSIFTKDDFFTRYVLIFLSLSTSCPANSCLPLTASHFQLLTENTPRAMFSRLADGFRAARAALTRKSPILNQERGDVAHTPLGDASSSATHNRHINPATHGIDCFKAYDFVIVGAGAEELVSRKMIQDAADGGHALLYVRGKDAIGEAVEVYRDLIAAMMPDSLVSAVWDVIFQAVEVEDVANFATAAETAVAKVNTMVAEYEAECAENARQYQTMMADDMAASMELLEMLSRQNVDMEDDDDYDDVSLPDWLLAANAANAYLNEPPCYMAMCQVTGELVVV